METWVLVLLLFGNGDQNPAITNIPLGISTREECYKVAQQWKDVGLPGKRLATCIRVGEWSR